MPPFVANTFCHPTLALPRISKGASTYPDAQALACPAPQHTTPPGPSTIPLHLRFGKFLLPPPPLAVSPPSFQAPTPTNFPIVPPAAFAFSLPHPHPSLYLPCTPPHPQAGGRKNYMPWWNLVPLPYYLPFSGNPLCDQGGLIVEKEHYLSLLV